RKSCSGRRYGGEYRTGRSAGMNPDSDALVTDLYQFTMLDAYYRLGMEQVAIFELFVRRLRDARNFLVAAGLEQVLDYLESLRFTSTQLEWLASTGKVSTELVR